MILVDSDVLVALVDRAHPRHPACVETLQGLRQPLGCVWPVLAAAITSCHGFAPAQAAILEMVARGAVGLLPLGLEDAPRLRELLAKRRPRPLSLAHAALVRVAERDGLDTVFTLAADELGGLTTRGKRALRLVPAAGRVRTAAGVSGRRRARPRR